MRKFALLIFAALGCFGTAAAARLTLADNGTTGYTIVRANPDSKWEKDTAADLAAILKEITGAEFPVSLKPARKNIFIGRIPASDKKPLAPRERRIAVCGDDLYFYGDDVSGAAFAAYDFLDRLGCRWFSFYGDRHIPKIDPLIWKHEGIFSFIPSFEACEIASAIIETTPGVLEFTRRNRIFLFPGYSKDKEYTAFQCIGPPVHGIGAWIHNSGEPKSRFIRWFHQDHPELGSKSYFKSNPEYFSMVPNGHRYAHRQFCFSNPDVRKLLFENIKSVIAKEYKNDRSAILGIDVNDNSGPFCCCSDCRILEAKYGSPIGPYMDFLLELSPYFKKHHPKLMLRFLAYQDTLSERPPKGIVIPDNIIPNFAPLAADFAKPLDHPHNRYEYNNFASWAKTSSRMGMWLYPNPYPFPGWSVPILVGVDRIAANLRIARDFKTTTIMSEFGGLLNGNFAFKELIVYATARLVNNVSLDEKEIVREFSANYYGKAAEKMIAYIAEVEALTAKDPNFISYQADPLAAGFITPANLIRWQKYFDEMEKLVAGDPRHLLNVRRARINLDLTFIQLLPEIRPDDPEAVIKEISRRHQQTLKDDLDDVFSRPVDRQNAEKLKNAFLKAQLQRGLFKYIRIARGPIHPLPEEFSGKQAKRLFPDHIKNNPAADPDGAYGVSVEIKQNHGKLRLFQRDKKRWIPLENSDRLLHPKNLSKLSSDKFKLYYLGTQKLTADTILRLPAKSWRLDYFAGRIFDRRNPDAAYDFYLSLRYDRKKKRILTDQLVVVRSDKTPDDAEPVQPLPTPQISGLPERGAVYIYPGNSRQSLKVLQSRPASLKIFPMQKGNKKDRMQAFVHTFRGGGHDPEFGEIYLKLQCIGDGTLAVGLHSYKVKSGTKTTLLPLWMGIANLKINGKTVLAKSQVYSKIFKVPNSRIKVRSGDIVEIKVMLSRLTKEHVRSLNKRRMKAVK